jgi:hypothetical protein
VAREYGVEPPNSPAIFAIDIDPEAGNVIFWYL